MWWRLAAGAVIGLAVGSFAPPGPALWLVLGVAGGYLADLALKRRAKGERETAV